jgi:hypothetical protein
MTCRSLLWIAATAVSIGAATSHPSVAVAEPGAGWTVTIDSPAAGAVVESKHLTIHGTVSNGAGVDGVTVTVVPQGLPPQCGPETGPATLAGGGYVIELDVTCNGPYRIEVVADGPSGSATGDQRIVGVAERPPRPATPQTDVTAEGGLQATWTPGDDPDTDGTILMVNFREDRFDPGIGEATLPPSDRNATVAIRALRWGAGGPGTTSISSPESGGTYISPKPLESEPPGDPGPPSDPDPDPRTPQPPVPQGPTSQSPQPTPADATTSTPSTAPSATVPAEPSAEDGPTPRAVVHEAEPSPDTDERALSSAAPAGGMVRTTDDRSTGLVAPLGGLAVILAAVAAITWHRHRNASHGR